VNYLSAVAQAGQITAAARQLRLAQPTLSQGIAQLESELGVALLERHAHGVTLTPAGEAFLEKARAAIAAETEAAQTGKSLARAARGSIAIGFVGPPPLMSLPELLEAFAEMHPGAQLEFKDLPFPRGPTSSWLGPVDVAICHRPRAEPGVVVQPFMRQHRTAVLRGEHPLAGRAEIGAEDILDDVFIGFHAEVQREWSAFHCLDDVRGAPARTSDDEALTTLQMLATMSSAQYITVVPRRDARLAQTALPTVVTLPLPDVEPAVVSLAWRASNPNPLVASLAEAASGMDGAADGV
jgi:DNA-binding transcriptional LysR family regulator